MYKILFVSTLLTGTLISISALNWMTMWMGLELNLLSFIPLMNKSKNSLSSEASLKYFVVQVIASLMILLSIIFSKMAQEFLFTMENPAMVILNSAFLIKMGAAPFHFWFPEIMEGLNWMNTFLLLTWQKIAPLTLITYSFKANYFFFMVILTSMIISGLSSWNQLNLKKILVFSSINHLGWMISSLLVSQSLWSFYFILYGFLSMILIFIIKTSQSYNLNQLINTFSNQKILKISFFMTFLSLGGLPPFLGFMPKWLVLSSLIQSNLSFLGFVMVLSTLLMLFVYIRITLQVFLFKSPSKKIIFSTKTNWLALTSIFLNFGGFPIIFLTYNFF